MKLNNKYIIGCHVMFYEIDIVEEYLESVHLALEEVDNKDNVKVEMMWNMSQYFEEAETSTKMYEIRNKIESLGMKYHYITNKFYEWISNIIRPIKNRRQYSTSSLYERRR